MSPADISSSEIRVSHLPLIHLRWVSRVCQKPRAPCPGQHFSKWLTQCGQIGVGMSLFAELGVLMHQRSDWEGLHTTVTTWSNWNHHAFLKLFAFLSIVCLKEESLCVCSIVHSPYANSMLEGKFSSLKKSPKFILNILKGRFLHKNVGSVFA